jgi:hypothetical protein
MRSAAHQRFLVFSHERHFIFFMVSPELVRVERIIHSARDITDESFDLKEP